MLVEVREVPANHPIKKKMMKKVVICECDFCRKVFEHVSRDAHPTRIINQKLHFCCNEHKMAHEKHLTPDDLLPDSERFKDDPAYQEAMKQSMILPIFVSRKRL